MPRTLAACLTGAVLGFAGVVLGYPGALVATVVGAGVVAYYASRRPYTDVGWLLVGAGIVVLALLGRVVAMSLFDSAITIHLPTYLGAAAGVLLLGTGAMVLGVTYATRRRG